MITIEKEKQIPSPKIILLKKLLVKAIWIGVFCYFVSWLLGFKFGIFFYLRYYYLFSILPGEALVELVGLERLSWASKVLVGIIGILPSILIWLLILIIAALIRKAFIPLFPLKAIGSQKPKGKRILLWLGRGILIFFGIILLISTFLGQLLGTKLVPLRKALGVPVRVQSIVELLPPGANLPVKSRIFTESESSIPEHFLAEGNNSFEEIDLSKKTNKLYGFWSEPKIICWNSHCGPREENSDRIAVAAQKDAFSRRLEMNFRVVPGSMLFLSIEPVGFRNEAREVEKLVLEFMNRFVELDADAEANGVLRFAPDMVMAAYSLEIWHQWGPLSGYGSVSRVILRKTAFGWLIVRFAGISSWIS